MNRNRRLLKKGGWYLSTLVLSFIFCFVFSYYTNPWETFEQFDSPFFRMVGLALPKGFLPYRDFFDMKGPYLFLIEYFGTLFSNSRIGVFAYQVLNIAVSLILIDKIVWFYSAKKPYLLRVGVLIPLMLFWGETYCGGNITEEFSLPFLLICTYYAVKYFSTPSGAPHPPLWAALYGACFGFLAMIRITNAASICAIVAFITVYLLIQKQYINLLHNALAFIGGTVISIIPAFIYCAYHGILSEMLYQVFAFGYTYAAEGGLLNLFFFKILTAKYTVFFIFPLVTLIFTNWKERMPYFIVFQAAVMLVVLSMGNSYPHYFVLMTPYLVTGAALMIRAWMSEDKKHLKRAAVIVIVAVSTFYAKPMAYTMYFRVQPFFDYFTLSADAYADRYVDQAAKDIAAYIPEEDRDSVYTYEISSSWYIETGLFPCIRYCDWQNHYIELSPEVQEDLESILRTTPPKWFVTSFDTEPTNPEFIKEILETQYSSFAENEKYHLWKLN